MNLRDEKPSVNGEGDTLWRYERVTPNKLNMSKNACRENFEKKN